jgi:hypothetical protein
MHCFALQMYHSAGTLDSTQRRLQRSHALPYHFGVQPTDAPHGRHNAAAAKKAIELLSERADGGQQYFDSTFNNPAARQALKALNEPMIGDGLVKSDNDPTFWLAAMMAGSPKLDMNDLSRDAAMPLSSLRRDPWTDQVITMHAAYEPC